MLTQFNLLQTQYHWSYSTLPEEISEVNLIQLESFDSVYISLFFFTFFPNRFGPKIFKHGLKTIQVMHVCKYPNVRMFNIMGTTLLSNFVCTVVHI